MGRACPPPPGCSAGCLETFDVPIFEEGEYAAAAQQIHRVIGCGIALIDLTWIAHISRALGRQECLALSGRATLFLGLFLLFWCLCLLSPGNALNGKLWAYVTSDSVQLQHLAVGASLAAAGLCEVCCAAVGGRGDWDLALPPKAPRGQRRAWAARVAWKARALCGLHVGWAANMSMVGVIFFTHPQKTRESARLHWILGASLAAGALSMLATKVAETLYALHRARHRARARARTGGVPPARERAAGRRRHLEFVLPLAVPSVAFITAAVLPLTQSLP